jgi:hypothetical protein
MSKLTRTLSALALFLALSGPIAAQSLQERSHLSHTIADSISSLWEWVSTPLAHLLKGRGALDPNGITVPPTTDARGACDPDGLATCGS